MNNYLRPLRTIAGVIAISCLLKSSVAVPITTLFNTGVDSSGATLPDGTVGDPHYQLIAVPGGTTDIQVRTAAGGFPISGGLWMGDNGISAWIGPNNPANSTPPGVETGIFVYRTTFDLSGLDPISASISGQLSSDNWLTDVVLNGTSLGITAAFEAFRYFTPFAISSSFVAGVNTLDFVVNNGSGPTGLRVEMTGTANPVINTPDGKATVVMLALALVVLAAMRSGLTYFVISRHCKMPFRL